MDAHMHLLEALVKERLAAARAESVRRALLASGDVNPRAIKGVNVGVALREWARRRHTQRLTDLQSEEIIYSNNELEKKFGELETRIEQLSLLVELSAAVNSTLDPEKIYDQALDRLVDRMGYEASFLSQVHAQALLAAVVLDPVRALFADPRRVVPGLLATEALDLDDLRPQTSEHLGATGS